MRILLPFLLLLISATPVLAFAQTPAAMTGLQTIAERQYAIELDKPIDTSGDGIFMATARVYQFDSEANANPTYEQLVDAEGVRSQLPADDDSVKLETTELNDVGDRGTVLHLQADLQEGELGYFRTAIVQQGAMVVTVTVIAGTTEASEAAEGIATAMIDREPGDDAGTYEGNGKSTGGVWDVFLPEDAEELGGLQAYMDKEMRPRS